MLVQQVSGCSWLLCAGRPEMRLSQPCPGGAAGLGVGPWPGCLSAPIASHCRELEMTALGLPQLCAGFLSTNEPAASNCVSQI